MLLTVLWMPIAWAQENSTSNISQKIIQTAETPGANCTPARKPQKWNASEEEEAKKNQWYIPVKITDFKGIPIEERAYICDSPQGMAGLQEFARNLIRWVINIALLLGVLWIACLGVAWIIAGDNDTEEKRKIKWWLTNLIVGLIILFFFQQILRFIAPWIYN